MSMNIRPAEFNEANKFIQGKDAKSESGDFSIKKLGEFALEVTDIKNKTTIVVNLTKNSQQFSNYKDACTVARCALTAKLGQPSQVTIDGSRTYEFTVASKSKKPDIQNANQFVPDKLRVRDNNPPSHAQSAESRVAAGKAALKDIDKFMEEQAEAGGKAQAASAKSSNFQSSMDELLKDSETFLKELETEEESEEVEMPKGSSLDEIDKFMKFQASLNKIESFISHLERLIVKDPNNKVDLEADIHKLENMAQLLKKSSSSNKMSDLEKAHAAIADFPGLAQKYFPK